MKPITREQHLELLIQELESSKQNRYVGDENYIQQLEDEIDTLHKQVLGTIN